MAVDKKNIDEQIRLVWRRLSRAVVTAIIPADIYKVLTTDYPHLPAVFNGKECHDRLVPDDDYLDYYQLSMTPFRVAQALSSLPLSVAVLVELHHRRVTALELMLVVTGRKAVAKQYCAKLWWQAQER